MNSIKVFMSACGCVLGNPSTFIYVCLLSSRASIWLTPVESKCVFSSVLLRLGRALLHAVEWRIIEVRVGVGLVRVWRRAA